jgi:GntR family transcriptional regulator, transcriptional repressor for pyruvate dehydrogenase complex
MTVTSLSNIRSKSVKLVDSIAEQIERFIIDREIKAGEKIPPSRELQSLLGISQGTLREALRILGQKGLIETKLGRNGGLFVKEVNSDSINDSLNLMIRQKQISNSHLAEVRIVLEVLGATLAASGAEKSDLDNLKKLVKASKKHLRKGVEGWEAFYKVEDRMHYTLAQMTKNPLVESILTTLYRNYRGYNIENVHHKIESMEKAYENWLELLDAIENKQPSKAKQIMSKHINLEHYQ